MPIFVGPSSISGSGISRPYAIEAPKVPYFYSLVKSLGFLRALAIFLDMAVYVNDTTTTLQRHYNDERTTMSELRFSLPPETASEWREAARVMGMPMGAWIRLQIAGKREPPLAPVQETVPLRERLLLMIGNGPVNKRDILKLAQRLGVPARSVHASLGSMVASKRMVRVADEYRRV